MLVDTHAHLNFLEFAGDIDSVITRAREAGVAKIVCASSNLADSQLAVEISKKYPEIVFAAGGIHPQETDPERGDSIEKQLEKLAGLAKNENLIAIGECGMDLSPAPPGEKDRTLPDQEKLFRGQVEVARKQKLPLIIHVRKAFDEALKILSDYNDIRGVFHCYYGGKKRLDEVIRRGFFFGFDGNLTYDPGLQNVAALVPLEKILVETDAPFLAPEPHRDERNEPAYVKIVASKLAELKNIPLEEIEKITTTNAQILFFYERQNNPLH